MIRRRKATRVKLTGAGGTYLLLFHRPCSRGTLIGTKLFLGTAVLLVGGAVPILVYGWWASTPGTHASPFEWAMTDLVWKLCLSMTVVYLGSFLSGIRPGRWKGTRLLPFAAACIFAAFSSSVPWVSLVAGLVVLVDLVMVVEILHVAQTRDY